MMWTLKISRNDAAKKCRMSKAEGRKGEVESREPEKRMSERPGCNWLLTSDN